MGENENFDHRLDQALKREEINTPAAPESDAAERSALAHGMRIGIEFASGPLVGAGIGYGLDYVCGTLPLFLIIFLLLGFGAGMLNIYRYVNNIPEGIGINRENGLTKQVKKPTHTPTD